MSEIGSFIFMIITIISVAVGFVTLLYWLKTWELNCMYILFFDLFIVYASYVNTMRED